MFKLKISLLILFITCLGLSLGCVQVLAQSKAATSSKEADDQSKNSQVRSNMREFQKALDSYFLDNDGQYPTSIDDDFKSQMQAKSGLTNPFTKQAEWPQISSTDKADNVLKAKDRKLLPGKIEYWQIKGKNNQITGYAIIGGGANGLPVTDGIGSNSYVLISH